MANINKVKAQGTIYDIEDTVARSMSGGSAEKQEGYTTPQMFGAKADGVADDTDAINQAIQASKYLLFPYGTYKTTGTILIDKEIKIEQYGVINYSGSGSAVKITGNIANRTDLYFADIEALNGTGIEFYSSYFNSSDDTDRIMYLNLYFGTIRAKEKCIYFNRGNNGEPMTDGFMNEIHIYNGKFGGNAEYGIYADSRSYSAINNVKLINVSLEGVKTGIYLKDNIYRWSFINLRYAEAPTNYHIQTVGVVSDIMWFGTNKLYENYMNFSSGTSGLLISPMAKNANYYMARINNGVLEYIDPLIDNAVQVTGANSAKFNFASSNGRLQWSMDGNFTINGTAYTRLMMFLGTDGNLGLSAYNGSWTALVKSKIDGHVLLGAGVDSADVTWATANSRFAQTIEGSFAVDNVSYSKIMFYLGADGQIGLSGYNGSAWVALTKGTVKPTDKVTVGGSTVTQELKENTFYVFGTVSNLTITLATPAEASILNEYHFRFTSGSTATTLSLPSNVTMPSDFVVEANKVYEISIVDGYGVYTAW